MGNASFIPQRRYIFSELSIVRVMYTAASLLTHSHFKNTLRLINSSVISVFLTIIEKPCTVCGTALQYVFARLLAL